MQSRRCLWFNNEGVNYKYGRYELPARRFPNFLSEIKEDLESHRRLTVNSCLVNYYHDGSHHVPFHADDEGIFVMGHEIMSLSFGQERTFLIRGYRQETGLEELEVVLPTGSLLVMGGATQTNYQHSVPKDSSTKPRINLTFRMLQKM